MSDELKDQRIPIMMTASEVAAIDDWSFANRIRSRAEAIRRLCQMALTYGEHAEELASGADKLLGMIERDDGVGAVETGEIAVQDWLITHFEQESEMVDAVIELASDIRAMEIVRKFYTDGDKNPSLHRAQEMRDRLKVIRERQIKAVSNRTEE